MSLEHDFVHDGVANLILLIYEVETVMRCEKRGIANLSRSIQTMHSQDNP